MRAIGAADSRPLGGVVGGGSLLLGDTGSGLACIRSRVLGRVADEGDDAGSEATTSAMATTVSSAGGPCAPAVRCASTRSAWRAVDRPRRSSLGVGDARPSRRLPRSPPPAARLGTTPRRGVPPSSHARAASERCWSWTSHCSVLVDPGGEPRPPRQQRLVGDLDGRLAGGRDRGRRRAAGLRRIGRRLSAWPRRARRADARRRVSGRSAPTATRRAEQVSRGTDGATDRVRVNSFGATSDRRRHAADVIERVASDHRVDPPVVQLGQRELEERQRAGSGDRLGDEVGDDTLVEGHADSGGRRVIASRGRLATSARRTYAPAPTAARPTDARAAVEQVGPHRCHHPYVDDHVVDGGGDERRGRRSRSSSASSSSTPRTGRPPPRTVLRRLAMSVSVSSVGTATSVRAVRNASSGSLSGSIVTTVAPSERSRGTRPARTTELFPEPDDADHGDEPVRSDESRPGRRPRRPDRGTGGVALVERTQAPVRVDTGRCSHRPSVARRSDAAESTTRRRSELSSGR